MPCHMCCISVAAFHQYSPSYAQLFAGSSISDWSPRWPISREMFVDPSQSNHLIVAWWSPNSPFIRRFLPCLETVWWANGACGDYNMTIQRTFSKSHQMYSPQILAKCSPNNPQLRTCSPVSCFLRPGIVAGIFIIPKALGRTFRERSMNTENVRRTRRTFG